MRGIWPSGRPHGVTARVDHKDLGASAVSSELVCATITGTDPIMARNTQLKFDNDNRDYISWGGPRPSGKVVRRSHTTVY
jgi:hypothetical protein